jgi:hypothetical protein
MLINRRTISIDIHCTLKCTPIALCLCIACKRCEENLVCEVSPIITGVVKIWSLGDSFVLRLFYPQLSSMSYTLDNTLRLRLQERKDIFVTTYKIETEMVTLNLISARVVNRNL